MTSRICSCFWFSFRIFCFNNTCAEEIVNLIVDSGAYTVWTKGQNIDLDKYIFFCQELEKQDKFRNIYFTNLDVIPGEFGYKPRVKDIEESAIQGWKNYEKMKKAGLKVIHIFHQHENFKWLDKLIKDDSDYIGISPANDLSTKPRLKWLKKVFYQIRDKKKTHGYGVTNMEILSRIPFYSVDSTSWLSGGRFGTNMKYENFKMRTGIHWKDKTRMLKYNIPVQNIENYSERLRTNIREMLKMQKDITRLWENRGINYS